MTVHVYVGPTLSSAEIGSLMPGARVHDPVRHGDLLREDFRPGDRVLIVDGYYHHTGSVRHKEILHLIDGGVLVAGCASMGALRAAELAAFGMVGLGEVFDLYHRGVITGDDEVAVAHTEGPQFRRLSEPLVNIRHVLRMLADDGVITAADAGALLDVARALPYTSRSWPAIDDLVRRKEPALVAGLGTVRDHVGRDPQRWDRKAQDTRMALAWLSEPADPVDTAGWPEGWRTRHLHEWITQFRGTVVDDVEVDGLAVVRYRQLYDSAFPARWRAHVLARIGTVDSGELATWLTDEEIHALPPGELQARALVRSCRPPRGLADLAEAAASGQPDDEATVRAVAEAVATNEVVAEESPEWRISSLREDVLHTHLAGLWDVAPADARAFAAAARDRGFSSTVEAVEALRPFFLRDHLALGEPASESEAAI
ncbi:TfuA-like protein [Kutzneria sp. NPDC052558]|uniref:TfuA-like protein n=1 Tax=Kutzneria sp. NPDC052558 TaxID=3364121 RepID=UPI0037C99CA2